MEFDRRWKQRGLWLHRELGFRVWGLGCSGDCSRGAYFVFEVGSRGNTLALHLSLSLSLSPSLYQSRTDIYACIYMYIHICANEHMNKAISINSSLYQSIQPSLYLSILFRLFPPSHLSFGDDARAHTSPSCAYTLSQITSPVSSVYLESSR